MIAEDNTFRGIRKKKGYTREYVADYLNISSQSLSQRELRQIGFRAEECKALCTLYNVDLRDVTL